MPNIPCPAARSSTRTGPAAAMSRMSAIACAAGIISGTMAFANSIQIGFSAATVLPEADTLPRRTVSVRSSKFPFSPGSIRKFAIVPMYAGDRWLRNVAVFRGS
jgi:hypothetical protein